MDWWFGHRDQTSQEQGRDNPPHSSLLVLPKMMAPAARSFSTTLESPAGCDPTRAYEPAVVFIHAYVITVIQCRQRSIWLYVPLSARVLILSFTRIGMPCRALLRLLPRDRSSSKVEATSTADGFISSTARNPGPCMLTSLIRAMYAFTRSTLEKCPRSKPSCRSRIDASYRSGRDRASRAGCGND